VIERVRPPLCSPAALAALMWINAAQVAAGSAVCPVLDLRQIAAKGTP
jgi:hypothetical protein